MLLESVSDKSLAELIEESKKAHPQATGKGSLGSKAAKILLSLKKLEDEINFSKLSAEDQKSVAVHIESARTHLEEMSSTLNKAAL